jgi:hypothetical protein
LGRPLLLFLPFLTAALLPTRRRCRRRRRAEAKVLARRPTHTSAVKNIAASRKCRQSAFQIAAEKDLARARKSGALAPK